MNGAALWLVLFGALLRRACPTIFHDDSPETVIASLSLGTTHPPGDAPLVLLGRLWLGLPLGGPALRLNLLAAASFASAAVMLWHAVAGRARPAGRALAAVVVALLVLTNPEVAHQAAVAKGASYGFTLALLTALTATLMTGRAIPAGLLLGVLVAHHWMTAVAYAGAIVTATWLASRRIPGRRSIAIAVMMATLGGSSVLAMPIRARAAPTYDAGSPATLGRLSAHLLRASFLAQETSRPAADRPAQVVPIAASVFRQAGPGGMLLGAAGALLLVRAGVVPAAPLAASFLAPPILAGAYLALPHPLRHLYDTFLLPTWWMLVALAAGWIARARITPAVSAAFALAAIGQAALQAGAVTIRSPGRATWAFDFARAQLAPLPHGAVVLTVGDLDTFPLWHAQQATGSRADASVINWTWLAHRWYREQAARALGLPALRGAPDRASAVRVIATHSARAFFSVPVPHAGLPAGLHPVPRHLLVRWSASPGPAVPVRGWSARGYLEAAGRRRDWRADLAAGYTEETLHRLMQAARTGRL